VFEPLSHLKHPLLYEINTRCWLADLSRSRGARITLETVPDPEIERWVGLGFTHIWLMGVWTSGAKARARATTDFDAARYALALPDFQVEDIGASPYAISEYTVPTELGGDAGVCRFRQRLNDAGLKLVLDFVPNHLGLDHLWIRTRPELFVQSQKPQTGCFTPEGSGVCLAHGKDPNFPAWSDTVQVDYRREDARAAMLDLLLSVADRCDGVRCDMAMLMLNEVFQRTWRAFPPAVADYQGEFWDRAISETRKRIPGFLFLAEVYWDLEAALQGLGFDFTYDKELYDRLVDRDGPGVVRHLFKLTPQCLAAGAHFLENHDERRAAAVWKLPEHRAAATLVLTLPGMRLLHEGQLHGAARQLPVQLVRRHPEPADPEIRRVYDQLLQLLPHTAIGKGDFTLLRAQAADALDPSAEHVVLLRWQQRTDEFDLVAINFFHRPARVLAPGDPHDIRSWLMTDLLNPANAQPVQSSPGGFPIELAPYEARILRLNPQS
jgi:hypothetical protein